MKQKFVHWLWLGLSLVACTPNLSGVQKHLDDKNYAEAVQSVGRDEKRIQYLAALILKQAALDTDRALEMVNVLATSGRPGKKMLNLLSKQKDNALVAQLAQIALSSKRDFDASLSKQYRDSPYGDLRAKVVEHWGDAMDVRALEQWLVDIDPRVRRAAAAALVKREPDEHLAKLLKNALRVDPSTSVKVVIARAGKVLGKDAYLMLKPLADGKDLALRLAALEGLYSLGSADALEILSDSLSGSPDETTVLAAALLSASEASLAPNTKYNGWQRYQALLADPDEQIRLLALLHLDKTKLHLDKTKSDEIRQIRVKMLSDQSFQVIMSAAYALQRVPFEGEHPAISPLREMADKSVKPDLELLCLLTKLGDKEAVVHVKNALSDANEKDVMVFLNQANGEKRFWSVFVSYLSSKTAQVRIQSAKNILMTRLK